MKYLILIHSNPQFLQRWDGLSDAQREEFGRGHFALTDELAASGELIVSEGLPTRPWPSASRPETDRS